MPEFILRIGGEERPAAIALERDELPAVSRPAVEKTFPVRRSDLDVVGHVNNTQYVGWLLETVPDEVDSGLRPAALEVVFQREALYGDAVRSEAEPVPAAKGRSFCPRPAPRRRGPRPGSGGQPLGVNSRPWGSGRKGDRVAGKPHLGVWGQRRRSRR